MLKYNQLKCRPGYTSDDVIRALSDKLHISRESITKIKILKESLDARKKTDIFYSLSVAFEVPNEQQLLHKVGKRDSNLSVYKEIPFELPVCQTDHMKKRPVIVGAGPAGLFCAYYLALANLRPILLERGRPVEDRKKDVETFWETGVLDTTSNVQFGEGGAGTFSDGKLNTLNKDPFGYQKEVFRLFVEMGAKPEIQYQQKPHVGTDALFQIVRNLRTAIRAKGGDIYFESQMTDIFFTDCTDDPYN